MKKIFVYFFSIKIDLYWILIFFYFFISSVSYYFVCRSKLFSTVVISGWSHHLQTFSMFFAFSCFDPWCVHSQLQLNRDLVLCRCSSFFRLFNLNSCSAQWLFSSCLWPPKFNTESVLKRWSSGLWWYKLNTYTRVSTLSWHDGCMIVVVPLWHPHDSGLTVFAVLFSLRVSRATGCVMFPHGTCAMVFMELP